MNEVGILTAKLSVRNPLVCLLGIHIDRCISVALCVFSAYTDTKAETLSVGSMVLTVAATDADSSTTTDGQITYSFTSSQTHFVVNPSNGDIFLSKTLDRDTVPTHTFVVKASDGTLFATASVTLTVTDANDNTPVFGSNPYTYVTLFLSKLCNFILSVLVTDSLTTKNKKKCLTMTAKMTSCFVSQDQITVATNMTPLS